MFFFVWVWVLGLGWVLDLAPKDGSTILDFWIQNQGGLGLIEVNSKVGGPKLKSINTLRWQSVFNPRLAN